MDFIGSLCNTRDLSYIPSGVAMSQSFCDNKHVFNGSHKTVLHQSGQ